MGQYKECAQGVRDYFASFLKDADPETWERFEEMRAKDSAKNYWYNNANMKENGFETSDTPSVGSIWVSEYDVHGHVMVITEMNETGVVAYECNQKGPGGSLAANICQYRNYTYSELENKHKSTFLGYIKIIDGEDC